MSNQKYTPPQYGLNDFRCPHCGVHAKQDWLKEFNAFTTEQSKYGIAFLKMDRLSNREGKSNFRFNFCHNCGDFSVWANKKLVYPQQNTAPPQNEDMSEEVAQLYQEAANVVQFSSRASAALLRVALERLCDECKGEGRNLYEKVQHFVDKGKLSPDVSDMMDLIRKAGNEAAHPGEIDFNENPQIAEWLFELINYVAQEMITVPKKRKQTSEKLSRILKPNKESPQ